MTKHFNDSKCKVIVYFILFISAFKYRCAFNKDADVFAEVVLNYQLSSVFQEQSKASEWIQSLIDLHVYKNRLI